MSILWDYRTIIIKSQPLYLDSIHSKIILLFFGQSNEPLLCSDYQESRKAGIGPVGKRAQHSFK